MSNKLDYNSEEVMKILNNPTYNEAQKKDFFDKYKSNLKTSRKKEIINKVNELAKNNPIITEDTYINFLKKYEDDNLSKPFNVIEKEIKEFEQEMAIKYNEYLEEKKKEEEAKKIVETPVEEETPIEEEVEVPIINESKEIPVVLGEEEKEVSDDIFEGTNNVLNEEPETLVKPLVDDFGEAKDVMPQNINDNLGEKGNASAIIISIIAIIIGAIAMYTIIKFN